MSLQRPQGTTSQNHPQYPRGSTDPRQPSQHQHQYHRTIGNPSQHQQLQPNQQLPLHPSHLWVGQRQLVHHPSPSPRLPHLHGRQVAIVVHDHDVLAGRGVNIAQHPGNERFRALVTTRADDEYCARYTTSEKRAVAKEIIAHIQNLNPPGRFLRRPMRQKNIKGLDGPWEELSADETLKKTCQALRDCNRQDRTGYASSVAMPTDVQVNVERRTQTGLTNKQQAEQAAAKARREADARAELQIYGSAPSASVNVAVAMGSINNGPDAAHAASQGTISPSIESAAHWLKKQRTDLDLVTPLTTRTTPSTTATSMTDHSVALHTHGASTMPVSFEHSYVESSHPHMSPYAAAMPTSSPPQAPYPQAPREDEAATAAALAAASALYHADHTLVQSSGSNLSPHSSLGQDPLDPLHIAASAVAALDRQHEISNLRDASLDHDPANHHHQLRQHKHPHDQDQDLADEDHESLGPDADDADIRYSPGPASPFRDGDDFAVHHHLFD